MAHQHAISRAARPADLAADPDDPAPGRPADQDHLGPTGLAVDHRRLGRQLGIFDSDPLIGAGLPIWLPAGAAARRAVEDYLYQQERRAGYQHVNSPPLGRRELYEISGHWQHFGAEMFPPMRDGSEELVLRPSLCPHHALVYRGSGRSYRELPLRIAELGGMYRAERSGVLGGLARVRSIWLNDAHVFCTPDQVAAEVAAMLALAYRMHAALGVRRSGVRLSLRDPHGSYGGDEASWAAAEAMLRDGLSGVDYADAPGEAAFYAPKIDIQVADPAGREYTLATIQVDMHQPARFDLSYVDARGQRQRPVMVHRSLVGSLERLFAHLIEEHRGAFPAWYAPVQVVVAPVGAGQAGAAAGLRDRLVAAGLRAELSDQGSLSARIRQAALVPFVAVIGARELAQGSVAVRRRDGSALEPLPESEAVAWVIDQCRPPHPA